MGWVLLILAGGTASMVVPLLVARHLVNQHSKRHGRHLAAAARMAVENAEQDVIARRAATRPKELIR